MLDHIAHDLDEVDLVNQILSNSISVYGSDFLTKLNKHAVQNGLPRRRLIDTLALRPSIDIGSIAGDHLHRHRLRLSKILGRTFLRLLDVGEGADADLASYLLFDGDFARILIDLGRQDAIARKDEMAEFLFTN